MKSKATFILLVSLLTSHSCTAQVPLTDIEGRLSIYLPDDTTSVHIGKNAGISQLPFQLDNTIVGSNAGRSISDGDNNSFFGSQAGSKNEDGAWNSYFGRGAGGENTSGHSNSFFGMYSGFNNKTGDNNTYLGNWAGLKNVEGNNNIFLGSYCGSSISYGSNNILLGEVFDNWMSENDTIDNRLHIANLIYGEFDNDILQINGIHRISRDDAQQLAIINNGAGGTEWRLSSSNDTWNAGGGKFLIGTSSNTANAHFTIDAAGDVGIGTTNPTAPLHVNDFMKLEPRSVAPSCNTAVDEGTIYYDSVDQKFRGCVSNPSGPILFIWVDFH